MASFCNSNSLSPFSSYNSFEQARMNSYLNNMLQFDGNATDVDDEMASTEKRFETFKTWPESSPLKPVDLANAGFYYTGFRDQVRCFSCDLQLQEWKQGDDPFDEHRKINSNCNFVIEYEREKLGITCNPVAASHPETGSQGNSVLEGSSRNPYFTNQSIIRDPSYHTGHMQQQYYPVYNQPYQQGLSHVTSSSGVFVTSQYPHSIRPVLQTPEQFTVRPNSPVNPRIQQLPTDRTLSVNYTSMSTGFQESVRPPFDHGSMRNIDIPVLSPVLQHVPSVHVRTEDTHHTTSQTDLQNIHHRLATFIDWPEDCPVHPWELAAAGFFYMGNGDNVKCYKCKVALRNWEPDDTPWSEHKRWSPDCPLVREYVEHPRMPVEDQEQTAPSSRRSQLTAPMPGTSRLEECTSVYSQPEASQQYSLRITAQSGNQPQYNTSTPVELKHKYPMCISSAVRPSNSPCTVSETANNTDPSFNSTTLVDRDFTRVIEMGFTSEDINNAIAKQTERTGSGFAKLDDLMQALLDDSQTSSHLPLPSQTANPTKSHQQITTTHKRPTSPLLTQLALSHSSSFDKSNLGPKRGLKRSNSAPPGGSGSNLSTQVVRDLDKMQEERLICKICMDAEVGVVFIPCGHISCCPHCASGLDLCPMCRKPIQQVVRTFLS